jgi:hypothetical protein
MQAKGGWPRHTATFKLEATIKQMPNVFLQVKVTTMIFQTNKKKERLEVRLKQRRGRLRPALTFRIKTTIMKQVLWRQDE